MSIDLTPFSSFWDRHEVLKHIHDIADARMVAPWAVLGVTMARVISAAPPQIMLPPIIHAPASLNFFVALTGPSGAGKSGSKSCSYRYISVPGEAARKPLGSGEGIAMAFLEPDPNFTGRGPKPLVRNMTLGVVFDVDEITTLGELGSRDGSTIQSVLRTAWSGGQLGQTNASVDRIRLVEADSYRVAMVAGVQPRRSQVLFREDGSGSPQRFLWLPAIDPTMEYDEDQPFVSPRDLVLNMPPFPHVHQEFFVCETAWKAVRKANWEKQKGLEGALDGHLLLCQLKAAAALALMCDRTFRITEEWWSAAEEVMAVSNMTRAWAAGGAYEEMRENALSTGSEFGIRDAQKKVSESDEICRRVGKLILKWMDSYEHPLSKSDLYRHMSPADRKNIHTETFVDTDGVQRARSYSNFDLAWECLDDSNQISMLGYNRLKKPLWQRTGFVVTEYAGDRPEEG